jgi:hypothetical protein
MQTTTRKVLPMNGGTPVFTPPVGGLSFDRTPLASWLAPAPIRK